MKLKHDCGTDCIPPLAKLPPKVAVCLAKDTTNPEGLPSDWPARMEDRARVPVLPPGWVEMTREEYRAHLASHLSSFEAWEGAKVYEGPATGACG